MLRPIGLEPNPYTFNFSDHVCSGTAVSSVTIPTMWERLSETLALPEDLFLANEALISESHRRSREAGVPVDLPRVPASLGFDESRALHPDHRLLVVVAREMFRESYKAMAQRSALLLLTDLDGRIIGLYSSPEVVCSAADLGVRIGASVAESNCGSNAVSLALSCRQPIIVRGRQHYCRMFWDWCSVAAPIVSRTGNLFGCVQLSGAAKDELGQKLALVGLLAKQFGDHVDTASTLKDTHDCASSPDKTSSPMQRQILQLLTQGKTYKQIAHEISRSTRTVESQIEKLRRQAGVRTTAQLVATFSSNLLRANP